MTVYKEINFESSPKPHAWVTVINPTNHRLLLQACDDCGVVKSENSVAKRCRAASGLALISSAQSCYPHLSQLAVAV